MAGHRISRLEKEKARRGKTRRLVIVFLVVLLAGAGAGVGMNFLLARPGEKKTPGTTTSSKTGRHTNNSENGGTEKDDGSTAGRTERGPVSPQFNISQAMSHVFAMSEQIGPRPAGSIRESAAADYLLQKLGEFGYTVEEQPFTMPDGFGSRNIVGTRRGRRQGYTIIVGAHYDSPPDSRGAVDNGSGVGVVLELARVFARAGIEPTVKFIFFGSNRPGVSEMENRLGGSRRYAEMLGSMEKKEVVGVIVVDSVAQGQVLALRTQETGLQRIKAKLETFGREHNVATTLLKSTSDSDNIPFEGAEMPAVWIEWCEPGGRLVTDNNYSSVPAGKVETVGTLIESFLRELTADDLEELKY